MHLCLSDRQCQARAEGSRPSRRLPATSTVCRATGLVHHFDPLTPSIGGDAIGLHGRQEGAGIGNSARQDLLSVDFPAPSPTRPRTCQRSTRLTLSTT